MKPETLAVGGAFTAVVLGLAAQQTLAHVFAGLVLLTTRPFVVGDRVKFRGGSMAGEVEGVVSSQGLFYTTLVSGGDRTMIPNNVIMQLAVIPVSEPDRVELKATFNASVTPQKLQRMIEKAVTIPLRTKPHVRLEELSGDEVTVTIVAVPLNKADGPKLASDVLSAVRDSDLDGTPDAYDLPTPTGDHETTEVAPAAAARNGPRPSERSGSAGAKAGRDPGAGHDRRAGDREVHPGGPVDPVPADEGRAERGGVPGVHGGAEQGRLAEPRRRRCGRAGRGRRARCRARRPGGPARPRFRRARRSRGRGGRGG